MPHIVGWDIETVLDPRGFAAASSSRLLASLERCHALIELQICAFGIRNWEPRATTHARAAKKKPQAILLGASLRCLTLGCCDLAAGGCRGWGVPPSRPNVFTLEILLIWLHCTFVSAGCLKVGESCTLV